MAGEPTDGTDARSGTSRESAVGGPDGAGGRPGGDQEEQVSDVPELIRVATMLQSLGEEVRLLDLDEAARGRLAEIQLRAADAIDQNLSPGLREELGAFVPPFGEGTPTEAELRIAHAQLAGWLAGLFQGIQAAAMSRQIARGQGPPPQLERGGPADPRAGAGGTYL